MMKFNLGIIVVLMVSIMVDASALPKAKENKQGQASCYEVVPLPRNIELMEAGPFVLSDDCRILYDGENCGSEMERIAGFLAEYIGDYTGYSLEVRKLEKGESAEDAILLEIGKGKIEKEGYRIKVGENGIVVTGARPAGVFYGVQTLRKAIVGAEAVDGGYAFAAAQISDSPHFGYRGAHFDVSRHFFSVDEVKTYIDMMALHNMNTLHWHITEDQGWRVEIKRYPELTQKGAWREETLVGHLNDRPMKFDGEPYGGFYTQDEVREIVKYAAERYITIIPEVDLPGHMQAALHVYPELGCTGGPYKVWTIWGVSDDVLCAGNDKVLEFLDGVFTEILELFPSELIHIGGDECPKVRWENCPKCQAKADELGLTDEGGSTREQKLQSYVMKHVASFLKEHGRRAIGWDEILEGEAAEGAVVMSWRGEEGGIQASRLGHDVIMVPYSHLYFDFYQSKDVEKEPLAIGGYIPVQRVYEYDPVPEVLKKKEQSHIIGLQANLWTEYIKTFEHAQYMALPRWGALAENQWTYPEHKDYQAFRSRLVDMMTVYELEGYNYARHILGEEIPADSPQVRYVGRVEREAGQVSYDWAGTYFDTVLDGERLDVRMAVKGDAWFNVFADGKFVKKFRVHSPVDNVKDTVVVLVDGFCRLGAWESDVPVADFVCPGEYTDGKHLITLQKCTEGEYGTAIIKGFIVPEGSSLSLRQDVPQRHIEFIGNSLTCGFGTEGKDKNEPFMVSTENCNLAYGAVVARYFGADYTFIAHSGQGVVRNYGDSKTVSDVNMQDRMLRQYDMSPEAWQADYKPDLVVIALGSNDFSVPPVPSQEEFVPGYSNLISQVKSLYGEVPVICLCPPTIGKLLEDYIGKAAEMDYGLPVRAAVLSPGLYNMDSDLGSAWHPNYSGQRKMAMGLIPFVSSVMGWEPVPGKVVE